jgi:2,4-dienoyl-CoA reductase-like NADH-dependent reductase (Old Yellow Enzyme family)
MSELFQSARIGSIEVRNRFVRSATWDGMAEDNGAVTERMLDLYRSLAKGGVGLILTGYAFVTLRGKAGPGMLSADSDELVPGLGKLAAVAHEDGAKIVLQIAHGGSQTIAKTGMTPEAPSAVEDRMTRKLPVEMTQDDIERVKQEFAAAARRGKEAGFDGVQLHAAHGYLISQFLSPYCNVRSDDYGGSIENRARMLFETYEAIRDRVGGDYPVMMKINVSDFDGVGLTDNDSLWVCQKMSEMGMDAIELSGGVPAAGELSAARFAINSPEKEAYFRDYAKRFKPHLDCPVILVGGLRSIGVMEEIYGEESAQFFSLCRPFISEPDLINRWQSGDTEPARCISCNKCLTTAFMGESLRCVAFDEEGESVK